MTDIIIGNTQPGTGPRFPMTPTLCKMGLKTFSKSIRFIFYNNKILLYIILWVHSRVSFS